MKPHRLALTHNLVLNYGLTKQMKVFTPHVACDADLERFHSSEYVEFLKRVTPDNAHAWTDQMSRFLGGEDCPIFRGIHRFCSLYTGGSLDGAAKLITNQCDISINWSGGLHHARREEASGFCYVNDCVLAILELLKVHPRVLYIDIDVHHGDGVQDAFYCTNRVMCLSVHKYGGDFFPGTGDLSEIGAQAGRGYSINVPLHDGIDDEGYMSVFGPVLSAVMEKFRPSAVVLQCGADSLNCDRLGVFSLSVRGHGECVKLVQSYGLPMLVLGGGGYTIRNVARCWTYETSVLLNTEISNDLPYNDYFEYYGPDYQLHPPLSLTYENMNDRYYLETVKTFCIETLRSIEGAPSVCFSQVPPSIFTDDAWYEDDEDPDHRAADPGYAEEALPDEKEREMR